MYSIPTAPIVPGELAHTGATLLPLAVAALLMIMTGTMALRAAHLRRRRTNDR